MEHHFFNDVDKNAHDSSLPYKSNFILNENRNSLLPYLWW